MSQPIAKKPKLEETHILFLESYPKEMWEEILSRLVRKNEIFKTRSVCRTFQNLTLPAIQVYLRRQETLRAEDLVRLHLPLFYLLIHQNPAFKAPKFDIPSKELYGLWKNYCIPLVFSYALRFCVNVKELDLLHPKYSIETILGKFQNFNAEVATQDAYASLTCTTNEQIDPIVDIMINLFPNEPFYLEKVEKLKMDELSEKFVEEVAKKFPNLRFLEISSGEYTPEELQNLKKHFHKLEKCTLSTVTFTQ
ncbi:MAG: hypothetical protein K1000chlam3_00382 [Chlamydiae bacterium]|nr:hypothetical protein [Chlamydiota bacterium]